MLVKNNVEQLNDYVINYVEDFFIYIESKGSVKTEDRYKKYVGDFIKYLFGYELKFLTKEDLIKIEADQVIKYINYLYKEEDTQGNKRYMNSSINPILSAIKQFLRYMKFRKVIKLDVNDLSFVKGFKKDSVAHETVPMNIVFAMIDDIRKNESKLATEKEWFIKIAVETGLRANEILRLTKKQFILLPDGVYVLIKSIGSNKGKGNKDWKEKIKLVLFNDLKEALFRGEREELFTMSLSTITKTIHRSQQRLGLDTTYTPHSLKRTAVNNTRILTKDLKATQAKAKHSNINTTIGNYVDDIEYGATGYFSMMSEVDGNLMNEVEHDILMEALNGLDDSTKLLINIKVQEVLKNK